MSDFRMKTCVLGMVSTNCYLIYREGSKETIIVDPADNAPYILNRCKELGVIPGAIFLTHGHFDHVLAVPDIQRAFPVKVYAGMAEARLLKAPSMNLPWGHANPQQPIVPDVMLKDNENLELLGHRWRIITTPGHTEGSICYYLESEGILLSGDTLFEESLGRTDLEGGSSSDIIDSITEKLFLLPDDTTVYPGHGDPTTIGHEKRYNPVAVYRR